METLRGLMVREKWALLLLSGEKVMELRNCNCRVVKSGDEVELVATGQGHRFHKSYVYKLSLWS